MESFRRVLSDWFGYDRRERRSVVVVILLMVAVAAFRMSLPEAGELPDIVAVDKWEERVNGVEKSFAGQSGNKAIQTKDVAGRTSMAVLNLNLCDSADLERLPGIGPVLSARIIKYRNLLGGYADKNQLLEVYGLRDTVFGLISDRVKADTSLLRKINVNTATYSELLRHPYLEPEHVSSIFRHRERQGSIENWGVLVEGKMIPVERESILRFYLTF